MNDRFNFNIDRVKEYVSKLSENLSNKSLKIPENNTAAILSIFDTNVDGKISRKEFESITEEQYNKFVEQVEQYNTKNPTDFNSKLFGYNDLERFLEDNHITQNELEGMTYQYTLKNKNLPETKTLKDAEQMSNEEIIEELKQYGIDEISTNRKKLLNTLKDVRTQRAIIDENSDIIDGHIGTYTQPEYNNMCTLLAQLDTMTDEEISELYQEKIDINGNKYYEVKFPGAQQAVIVSAEEIENAEITITENNKERVFSDFTKGDADVRMFEMAFIKAFGPEVMDTGDWPFNTQNRLNQDYSRPYNYTQNAENITDYKSIPRNAIFSVLTSDEQSDKNLPKELILSNGQKLNINQFNEIVISDENGTSYKVVGGHALQFRGYNEATNEIILSGNSMNNLSEIRLPADPKLLQYFQLDTRLDELKTT